MGSVCVKSESDASLKPQEGPPRREHTETRLVSRRNALRKQDSSSGFLEYPDPTQLLQAVRGITDVKAVRLKKSSTKQSLVGNLQISLLASMTDAPAVRKISTAEEQKRRNDSWKMDEFLESFDDFEKRISNENDAGHVNGDVPDSNVQNREEIEGTTICGDNSPEGNAVVENGATAPLHQQVSLDEGVSCMDMIDSHNRPATIVTSQKRLTIRRMAGVSKDFSITSSLDEGIESPVTPVYTDSDNADN